MQHGPRGALDAVIEDVDAREDAQDDDEEAAAGKEGRRGAGCGRVRCGPHDVMLVLGYTDVAGRGVDLMAVFQMSGGERGIFLMAVFKTR